jgi:hypothetical protein
VGLLVLLKECYRPSCGPIFAAAVIQGHDLNTEVDSVLTEVQEILITGMHGWRRRAKQRGLASCAWPYSQKWPCALLAALSLGPQTKCSIREHG